ncbi:MULTISPECIES: three-Cys-motif partner protein TcmP [Bartonella]|uniref:three-Cys-motif partner protein TcmP n=1 Tax=Bartonella TaxID=773 RepID=UPI0018DB3B89|nr:MULTISPECIES: three-Cys-motif partner protein TcmP [Bartonella]MBH9995883.1 three-Cys-motif partner protein TcmP [Bartonella sp. P0291]MBH9998044.1 three-Cys-motif partner protein TcmP [Bartonella sp. M0192]MBI0000090.1 three-Cys-motif partner protein TcmP [Bartonella sp. M0191]MBI0008681.1 three-Cys-motif partner protein TcmP [Bartonella sp. M0193]MBI0011381.1 three-Cys-motif partner protein TcmP [Bartonella sp. M0176]
MTKKSYDWEKGAELGEHSKRKLKILREYFFRYLTVKCGNPLQSSFRLAVVDGFSGAGRYKTGVSGSPLIFIEELQKAYQNINVRRAVQRLKPITFDCILFFNDVDASAIELLKINLAPLIIDIKEKNSGLNIKIRYSNCIFEQRYRYIKEEINKLKIQNVIFNLDQYGYTHVTKEIIIDIMNSFKSVEILFTFMIGGFLQYASPSDIPKIQKNLDRIGISYEDLNAIRDIIDKKEWLGAAEKLIFDVFKECSTFFTPFSINHKDGYKYWLMHFANNYRARQEYNNVLHNNALHQAHFGRSGLNMLSYNSEDEGMLYLFDEEDRKVARGQLYDDIPNYINRNGGATQLREFYTKIFNNTPAHSDDIHKAIIENPDIEVITKAGGLRQKYNTIRADDYIRLKEQKSFFYFFTRKT